MCLSPQRRAIFRHLNRQKWSKHLMFCTFWLANVRFATAPGNFSTSERTKVVQTPHVLYILTCKCAFRHSRVQFFNIRTYQSGPNTSCFVHFHFRMCFSPQRRAFFWHLNLQKWSKTRHVLYIFTSECAFRHSGVHFFWHLNLQKWSKHVMFCTFSLPNVLFATAACIFFDIWTYKSAPNTSCFVHFHFRMCFSPQRRAIFAFFADHMTPHPPL